MAGNLDYNQRRRERYREDLSYRIFQQDRVREYMRLKARMNRVAKLRAGLPIFHVRLAAGAVRLSRKQFIELEKIGVIPSPYRREKDKARLYTSGQLAWMCLVFEKYSLFTNPFGRRIVTRAFDLESIQSHLHRLWNVQYSRELAEDLGLGLT